MYDARKKLIEQQKEIERLQAKLEQIDNHITNRVSEKDAEIERLEAHKEQCFDRMRAMQDEIERLQKAYRPADMIEYQELVAENERLQDIISEMLGEERYD
jgi:predicted nuclease with TOPRIM domain